MKYHMWMLWVPQSLFLASLPIAAYDLVMNYAWWKVYLLLPLSFIVFLSVQVAVSVGYHRLFTHRSFETSPFWETVLALTGSLILTGPPISWAVVHMAHHKHHDTEDDPQPSSVFLGQYKKVMYEPKKFISLWKKPLHRFLHNYYVAVQIGYAAVISIIGFYITRDVMDSALIWMYLHPLAIGSAAWNEAVVGYLTHAGDGVKRFPIDLKGIAGIDFFAGEGTHLAHHQSPRNPVFHQYPLRDIGGWLIQKIRTDK